MQNTFPRHTARALPHNVILGERRMPVSAERAGHRPDQRPDDPARKAAQRNKIAVMKALAHKLARASHRVVRDQVPFRPELLFA